jgi:hypothetical protein
MLHTRAAERLEVGLAAGLAEKKVSENLERN